MKTKITLSHLFILLTAISQGQDVRLKSFKIVAVEFGITIPASVSCPQFESSFPGKLYTTRIFRDSLLVFRLEQVLKRLEFKKEKPEGIDVRAKIYLDYGASNPPKVLCINKFYDMELDGESVKKNKRSIKFLEQLLKDFK